MESIKNKTVLLIDNGGCVELARRIVPDFKEVLYFNGYSGTGFPLENPHFVGTGIKGVNKIYDPFSYIDDVDLIIFSGVSSIQYGGMAEYFRSIGKRVVSAFYGQEMETDRIEHDPKTLCLCFFQKRSTLVLMDGVIGNIELLHCRLQKLNGGKDRDKQRG